MWLRCRQIALQQLKSNARLHSRLNDALSPFAAAPWHCQAARFTQVAGIDVQHLATRSRTELAQELGEDRLVDVRNALITEYGSDHVEQWQASKLEPVEMKQLFLAAAKTNASSVMLSIFRHMTTHAPQEVDFGMYGDLFRMLSRERDAKAMLDVYEVGRERYLSNCPEIVYRFGVNGHLEANDLDAAEAIWQEMSEAKLELPNATRTRLMVAHARAGHVDQVRQMYAQIDPQQGQWHESAIDRVILSLGLIKEPEKAFEFYCNSNMKLSSSTLVTLLSVSRHNGCDKQATDILANRTRFDLVLNTRAYNAIMETLEFLGRHEELVQILEEMSMSNVKWDRRTREIVRRNHEVLKETPYAMDEENGKATVARSGAKIRDHLSRKEYDKAAATADALLEEFLAEGQGNPVPASVSRDVMTAYLRHGEHSKVEKLLDRLSVLEGGYAGTFGEVVNFYVRGKGKQRHEAMLYKAMKALQSHGGFILPVYHAIDVFRNHEDVEAILALVNQVVEDQAHKQETQDGQPKKGSFAYSFPRVVQKALGALVSMEELSTALDVLKNLDEHGIKSNVTFSTDILIAMREANVAMKGTHKDAHRSRDLQCVYDADDFEKVWKDLQARGLPMDKLVLGNLCVGMAEGGKRHRLMLLEAYDQVRQRSDDAYTLPHICFSSLMTCAIMENDLDNVRRIYDDAVAGLEHGAQIPREWMSRFVIALARGGNVEEAVTLYLTMQERCGSYSYDAIIEVLRACAKAGETQSVAQLLELFEEQHFRISLRDAYELVHAAKRSKDAHLATEVVRLVETRMSEIGREAGVDGVQRMASLNPHTVRRVVTMYRMALTLCENSGDWKKALHFSAQLNRLLGDEEDDETEGSSLL